MARGYPFVSGCTFTVGTEACNVINVAGQLTKDDGSNVDEAVCLRWYHANDATGLTPTTTAQDGGTAIGTDGALIESVANLSGMIVTEADGSFDVDVTDAGAFTTYLVIVLPSGKLAISGAITHAA